MDLPEPGQIALAALDALGASVIVLDPAGGLVLVNRRAADVTGHTASELVGKTLWDTVLPAKEASRFEALFARVLAGEGPLTVLSAFRTKTGEEVILQHTLTVIPAGGGGIAHIVAASNPVGEPIAAERIAVAAVAAAESARRAMSQYFAHVGHEARTPLNAIIGFAEILARQLFGPLGHTKYVEYAKTIEDSGNHLLAIINDILDLSKADAGMLEIEDGLADICQSIMASARMMEERAERAGVAIEIDCPSDLPAIRGDVRKVRQALINLLSNGIKFTPAGGRVSVGAHIGVTGELVITVADTGVGMAPEDIPRAMAPFSQVASPVAEWEQGTGLGLSIVKALVELHDGTFELESAAGRGTTATMRFPASRVAGQAGATGSQS